MEKLQASLLNLLEAVQTGSRPELKTTLSFRPFIEYLRRNAEQADPIKAAICRAALDQFLEYPDLKDQIPVEDAARYQPLLEQVYALITPAMPVGDENPWALSLPALPYFFLRYCLLL